MLGVSQRGPQAAGSPPLGGAGLPPSSPSSWRPTAHQPPSAVSPSNLSPRLCPGMVWPLCPPVPTSSGLPSLTTASWAPAALGSTQPPLTALHVLRGKVPPLPPTSRPGPPEAVPRPTPPIHPLREVLGAPGCAGAPLPAEGSPGPSWRLSQATQRVSGFRERPRLIGQTGHPPARRPAAGGPFSQRIPAGQGSALHPVGGGGALVHSSDGPAPSRARGWGAPPSGGLFKDPAPPCLGGLLESSPCALPRGGAVNGVAAVESSAGLPQKLSRESPHHLAVPLLGVFFENRKLRLERVWAQPRSRRCGRCGPGGRDQRCREGPHGVSMSLAQGRCGGSLVTGS